MPRIPIGLTGPYNGRDDGRHARPAHDGVATGGLTAGVATAPRRVSLSPIRRAATPY